jgi:hypothetical protein
MSDSLGFLYRLISIGAFLVIPCVTANSSSALRGTAGQGVSNIDLLMRDPPKCTPHQLLISTRSSRDQPDYSPSSDSH